MILKTEETGALQPADFLSEEAVLADTEALAAEADSAAVEAAVLAEAEPVAAGKTVDFSF